MSTIQAPALTSEHSRDTTAVSMTSTVFDPSPYSDLPIIDEKRVNSIDTETGFLKQYDLQTPATPVRPLRTVIPAGHRHRTLIVCFDGTGDQFDNDNSNVVQFVSLLKKDDKDKQLVYYQDVSFAQAGIGTYNSPKIVSPTLSKLKLVLDLMFAGSLDAHVMCGYEFLMQNYVPTDKISIFGFSRGAFTARSLAGVLDRIGLLPAGNFQQVPFLYKMYKRDDKVGWKQASEFKKAFSLDVTIDFLGVWDTVESIGFKPTRLPFASSDFVIRTFRHALALDERRAKFKANTWNRRTKEQESRIETKASNYNYMTKQSKPTDVEEVWFAGCHCDVGGGSVSNATRHSLARIPLRWMVRECFKAHTGILFYADKLREIGLNPDKLYPYPKVWNRPAKLPVEGRKIQNPPQDPIPIKVQKFLKWQQENPDHVEVTEAMGSEEEEELKDALSPKYDQLKLAKWWYALEWMLLPFRHQTHPPRNNWEIKWRFNKGKPRKIPDQQTLGVKVHRSVQMRMSSEHEDDGRWRWPWKRNEPKRYEPKAKFNTAKHIIWVD